MGNTLGTTKVQKIQHPTSSPKEKKLSPLGTCWLTSLAVKNLYAYLPFYHFWHRLMGRGTNYATNSCFLLISWWVFTQSSLFWFFFKDYFDWPIPKSLLLLGTSWGTDWEHEKNPPKKNPFPYPQTQKKKSWALLNACGAFSLVAWKLWS
jgi:hypothetical protein